MDRPTSLSFDARQLEAIDACLDEGQRIVAVTGPAGSGKTTLIAEIVRQFGKRGRSVKLMAPTGKAARRVTQATGYPAVTIHRGLNYTQPYETDIKEDKKTHRVTISEPRRDKENPLPEDVVVVDEYAMVGRELHRNLFDAIRRGGSVRVFGDLHQLKPIEEGKVHKDQPSSFADLLHRFTGITLDTVHRQMGDSGVLYNAHRILAKRPPERRSDFKLELTSDILHKLRAVIERDAKEGIDYSKPDAQIITPSNKTNYGTLRLNNLLQSYYMRGQVPIHRPERHSKDGEDAIPIRLFMNDKVIITKNDYVLGVFNGETGYIVGFDPVTYELTIDLDDRVIHVPTFIEAVLTDRVLRYNPQKNIDLAYALTTHKCQGSEYDHVIYIMSKSMSFMQNRANLYTGVTRARKSVSLVTDPFSFRTAITREGT